MARRPTDVARLVHDPEADDSIAIAASVPPTPPANVASQQPRVGEPDSAADDRVVSQGSVIVR